MQRHSHTKACMVSQGQGWGPMARLVVMHMPALQHSRLSNLACMCFQTGVAPDATAGGRRGPNYSSPCRVNVVTMHAMHVRCP